MNHYLVKNMDDFIILDTFSETCDDYVVDGFVFSTKSLFKKLEELMNNNEVKKLMVDGTYKFC